MCELDPQSARVLPAHELVDHTSEIIVRLRARSFPEMIAEATRAFGDLVPERALGPMRDAWRDFEVDAGDRSATLVAWLNELVYLSEAETWLPVEPSVAPQGDTGVRVRVRERALEEPFVLVKAATLHGAAIEWTAEGLEAEVTLDV